MVLNFIQTCDGGMTRHYSHIVGHIPIMYPIIHNSYSYGGTTPHESHETWLWYLGIEKAPWPWHRGLKHSSHHGRDPMLNESLFVSLKSESFLGIFASGRLRGCSHIFVFSETMNPKEAVQLSRSKCQSHPSPFGSFHGSNLMMSSGGNVLKTIWRQIFIVSSPRPNRKYLWDLSSSVYTAHVHINTWRTDTHLLRNILSNYWCGTHLTCKNTSVKPDRSGWKTRSEKLCKGNLSMSLLEESNRSDAARSSSIDSGKSDFDNRAEKRWESNRLSGSRLSRMPSAKINEVVKVILQAMSTTSMPRSAGTGEWSVHPSPIIP